MSWRSFMFRAKQWARPLPRRFAAELCAVERLSVDEITALNWQRRIKLLEAATRASFYRRRFAEIGLEIEDVKSEKDWECIPILTRKDVQEHAEEMICDGVERRGLGISSTGGSTGEPLRLYRPRNIPYDAFAARMLGWWGVNMWDDSCYIFRHGYKGWRKIVNDLMWWPTKRVFLNAGNMSEETCEAFYRKIRKINPKLLVGYVGAVSTFADFLAKKDMPAPSSFKAVWTTSSPLPEPLRNSMQAVFNAPVYSQYGCCECGHLAAECTCQKGMHIHSDWRHLEFVDDSGRSVPVGEIGNVLVTDMYSLQVPLIRYALGDHGRMLSCQCTCGSRLPLMDSVKGRVSDIFPMPDGSCLSGDYLTTIFDDHPNTVRGFRVHQNRDYSIRVEYVPRDYSTVKSALKDAFQNLTKMTKGLVRIDFKEVGLIPHDYGKTRYVTSDVDSGGQ